MKKKNKKIFVKSKNRIKKSLKSKKIKTKTIIKSNQVTKKSSKTLKIKKKQKKLKSTDLKQDSFITKIVKFQFFYLCFLSNFLSNVLTCESNEVLRLQYQLLLNLLALLV